jgi:predicted DNA-binding protein with PD1-like motif
VQSITRIANEEGIKAGTVALYGVLSRLTLSNLDPATGMPRMIEREEVLEIASGGGTISQFKGRSMARLNGVFATVDGHAVAGVLAIGTVAYACEVVITELTGGTLSRDFDPESGLPLWKESSLLLEG